MKVCENRRKDYGNYNQLTKLSNHQIASLHWFPTKRASLSNLLLSVVKVCLIFEHDEFKQNFYLEIDAARRWPLPEFSLLKANHFPKLTWMDFWLLREVFSGSRGGCWLLAEATDFWLLWLLIETLSASFSPAASGTFNWDLPASYLHSEESISTIKRYRAFGRFFIVSLTNHW